MTQNEIKKALYKENPPAVLKEVLKGHLYYSTILGDGEVIRFLIPIDDLGDASFYCQMEAKYLIRYIL